MQFSTKYFNTIILVAFVVFFPRFPNILFNDLLAEPQNPMSLYIIIKIVVNIRYFLNANLYELSALTIPLIISFFDVDFNCNIGI
jgi:hypothetical protein